jgi:folate-binding protein YgfZ
MRKLTGVDLSRAPAPYAVLAIRGPDTTRFLQGQLSADIEKLASGASTFTGLHNPQGRVVAILALVRASAEEILAVVPAELAAVVTDKLRKFVFRSKVGIEDVSSKYLALGSAARSQDALNLGWGNRAVLLVPRDAPQIEIDDTDAAARTRWERADVTEGIPQVFAATSESFVAQMLNLDLLGGISFEKGCYTGQEVIARAHYRGRVKRRLQRWFHAGNSLAPGATARSTDGRALSVVRVVPGENGGQDLLAVGPFTVPGAPAESPEPQPLETGAPVVEPRAMPYLLPD